MSKLTKAERDELPESDFGDPSRKLFPIVDASDVSAAASLIGKAANPEAVRARVKAIARRKGFPIPDAWDDDAKMSVAAPGADDVVAVATFDIGDPVRDGDYVLYENSKLFEAGNYEDKAFEITPEEMWLAADRFTVAPVGLEHIPNVLDGKLGEVRSVRLSDDGCDLLGTVAIPKWLDDVLEVGRKKVSCEWDRATKTLKKLDLVLNPRVESAALMAAFAHYEVDDPGQGSVDPWPGLLAAFAHPHLKTPHGQATLQDIHDRAAMGGATCGTAHMATAHERSHLQKIHDAACAGGAKCNVSKSGDGPMPVVRPAYYSSPTPTERKKPMSLKETIKAVFMGARAEAGPEATEDAVFSKGAELVDALMPRPIEATELRTLEPIVSTIAAPPPAAEPTAEPTADFTKTPEFIAAIEAERARGEAALKAERDRVDRIEAERHAERLAAVASDSADFSNKQVDAGKVLPAGVAALGKLYAHLSLVDSGRTKATATVDFSEQAGELSVVPGESDAPKLVELLDAVFTALPDHGLYTEMVHPDGRAVKHGYRLHTADFGAAGGGKDVEAEADELIKMNPAFRSALAK